MRGRYNICRQKKLTDDNNLLYMTLLSLNGVAVVVVAKTSNPSEAQGGCLSIRRETTLQSSGLHCRGAVDKRQVRKTSNVKSRRKISINI